MVDMEELNVLSEKVISFAIQVHVSLDLDYLNLHIETAFSMNLTRPE